MVGWLVAAVVASSLMTGCSAIRAPSGFLEKLWHLEVGPDYTRPEVKVPEEFRDQVGPSEAASFADLPWWKVFGDPTLQQLIAEALANNFDLQAATARVEQERALVGVAASPLYPQVGYQGDAARQKAFIPVGPETNPTFNVFSGLLNVAWEIDV